MRAYLFLLLLTAISLFVDLYNTLGHLSFNFAFFLALIKSVLFIFFFINSAKTKSTRLNVKVYIGLILSYSSILLFNFTPSTEITNKIIIAVFVFSVFFYLIFIIDSIFSLKKSFSIIPENKNIITIGQYRLIRHPLYSAYIHLALVFCALSINTKNILGLLFLISGVLIRAIEEEELLSIDLNYIEYKKKVKSRFFVFQLSFPVVFLFLLISFLGVFQSKSNDFIKVNISFPVMSLYPETYDDWSSIFVGNHIYLSLMPQRKNLKDFSIAKGISIECLSGGEVSSCKKIVLKFFVEEHVGCDGQLYGYNDFQFEFEKIIQRHNWLLGKIEHCKSEKNNQICLILGNEADLIRKLNGLYFRFGWSKLPKSVKINNFGFGTHCLSAVMDEKSGFINEGLLSSRFKDSDNIEFKNYDKNGEEFTFGLYGASLSNFVTKVDTKTPLGYYVVSNPLIKENIPWFTVEAINIIEKHLVKSGLARDRSNSSLSFFIPSGSAKLEQKKLKRRIIPLLFGLPDFIPNCLGLASKLNENWEGAAIAACLNTSDYISKFVITRKKWDAFLTPLTPGAPTHSAISDQYFNVDSSEAWIHHNKPSNFYYLVAVGTSSVDARKNTICGVESTPMGLGDLLISDLIKCQ